jgi:hypothetical protein
MVEKRTRGGVAYYWRPPGRDVVKGCPVHAEALGVDFGGAIARAQLLNEHLDAWRNGLDEPRDIDLGALFGTVDWWVESYLRSEAYTSLSPRSREDYREALGRLADIETNLTDARTGKRGRVGALPAASLTPAAVDKLYALLRSRGAVRQANYPIDVARRAWKVVARKYPAQFLIPNPLNAKERIALNPFVGVERIRSEGTTEPASRAEAYAVAEGLAGIGHAALGAASLICYEWLQRPENVLAGIISWTDYRRAHHPGAVRIDHHKTRKKIWQPLEDEHGQLYPELEAFLARVPRLGVPIVLFEPLRGAKNETTGRRTPRLYSLEHARHLVQTARAKVNLPKHVTLAACRHGGMTELGDAGLTEPQIMSLSAHETPAAARVYVKRTEVQRMAAARKMRQFVDRRT